MCEPIALGTALTLGAAAVGTGATLYGASQSAGAANKAAAATQAANQAQMDAQNRAFTSRMGATNRQTAAQLAAMQDTSAERNTAANLARQAQTRALDTQQLQLTMDNRRGETLREEGDTRARTLLDATTAQQMEAAEAQRIAQQNLLLDQNMPVVGPDATDPTTSGQTKTALARRAAEAATNIRDYGSKVTRMSAYEQPMLNVGQAISANRTGIMPAQAADSLLRGGAGVRALPAQIEFRAAGSQGAAADEIIRSRGQSKLDTAALDYGNTTATANLTQANADVDAKNVLGQAKADAAYQQALAGIYGQLGQLGLYGAGRYGFGGASTAPVGAPTVPVGAVGGNTRIG